MEHLNKVELRGIVGYVRSHIVNGKISVDFTLATEYRYRDKAGIGIIDVTWHRVCAFESEKCQHLDRITSGCNLHVLGRLRSRRYIDNDGNERQSVDIVASEVHILGK